MTILKNAALKVCDAAFGSSERPLSVNDLEGLFHTLAGVLTSARHRRRREQLCLLHFTQTNDLRLAECRSDLVALRLGHTELLEVSPPRPHDSRQMLDHFNRRVF
jgi:hypothetical protein